MKTKLWILLLFPVLTSCQKDEEEIPGNVLSKSQFYVTAIHSPNGLGDRGYNDNLYKGIRESQLTHGFHLQSYSPLNMNEAEQLMINWMKDSIVTGTRMLVLGSSDFEPLLRKHADQLPSPEHGEIVLLESRATDMPAYTLYLPIYGACYQAGCIAMLFPYAHTSAVVCANRTEGPIADGLRGFKEGFTDSNGLQLDTYYLADDDIGYTMADSLYRLCHTLEQNYGFVFPICGGSNQGLIRFTREHPYTFYTAGMDVDQSDYSPKITFSVVKHIDRAISRFLQAWVNRETIPLHQRWGLSSDMVEVVASPAYKEFLGNSLEITNKTAIHKEEAYEKTK